MLIYHYKCNSCGAKWQASEEIHLCPFCLKMEVELNKNPARRKIRRHRQSIIVQWQADEAFGIGFTKDISLKGAGILTDRAVAHDTDVSIRFIADRRGIAAQGTVRWAYQIAEASAVDISCAMGVEFFDYSEEFGRFIRHLSPSDSQDINLCRAKDIGVKDFAECLVHSYPLHCRFAMSCANGQLCKHPNRGLIVKRTMNNLQNEMK